MLRRLKQDSQKQKYFSTDVPLILWRNQPEEANDQFFSNSIAHITDNLIHGLILSSLSEHMVCENENFGKRL